MPGVHALRWVFQTCELFEMAGSAQWDCEGMRLNTYIPHPDSHRINDQTPPQAAMMAVSLTS